MSYQDANTAAKNGKAIGDELKGTSLVLGLTEMWVGIHATYTADGTYGAGGVMFAFDTANTNGTNKYANKAAWDAAAIDKVLNVNSFTSTDLVWSKALPGIDNGGTDADVDVAPVGSVSYSGVSGAGTSVRQAGMWAALSFGLGFNLKATTGSSVMLGKVKLKIDQSKLALQNNATYGGLGLFSLTNAASRSTYLGTTTGTGQGTSKAYNITAAPEPGTMVAIAAGLAAVAARRRRK
ncbi:MAG: PEP-CTERM sorting domain-containing protein [Chthonomonas sp.]|nr:PEP-CTERM sorting domain-containing protein [Chthonomonas sp.]